MSKLTKKAIRDGWTYGWTDPNYRKASFKKRRILRKPKVYTRKGFAYYECWNTCWKNIFVFHPGLSASSCLL